MHRRNFVAMSLAAARLPPSVNGVLESVGYRRQVLVVGVCVLELIRRIVADEMRRFFLKKQQFGGVARSSQQNAENARGCE